MREKLFKDCKKELSTIDNLKNLFQLWQDAHIAESRELKEIIKKEGLQDDNKGLSEGEIFEHRLYKNRAKSAFGKTYKNTISSHFVPFFYKNNCEKCFNASQDIRSGEKNAWEYVLEHAFNMDGCVGGFDVKEGGYDYICLLKEANDSSKVCPKNYDVKMMDPKNVNSWILDWRGGKTARMLTKINKAFFRLINECKLEEQDAFCFCDDMAYMNVNKRGGAVQTAGLDEKAVINYAEKYREFILREIGILAGANEAVKIFVCGSPGYFMSLMNVLTGKNVKSDEKTCNLEYENKKLFCFINITHPSGWISEEKLAKEMAGIW